MRVPLRVLPRRLTALVAAGAIAIVAAAPASIAEPRAAAGALQLNASLALLSQLGGCEPTGAADECGARTVTGPFRGLGQVRATYSFLLDVGPPSCASDGVGKALAYPIRISVAGKGEIEVAVAEGSDCIDVEAIRTQTQTFAVTGGTGIYAGASGRGTLERTLGAVTPSGRRGRETWTGSLSVPGLEFDLTPPVFAGATGKTVTTAKGARFARVSYRVTATDDRDGAVPATCKPASGSRFALGRTRVRCDATDGSANSATTTFSVLVKARR